MTNKTLPIAVQLYTVRDALAQDWEGVLEQIAEMGFLGVETAGFGYAPSMEAALEKLNGLGLQQISAHGRMPLGDDKQPMLDMMDALGSNRLICAGTGHDRFGSIDSIKERVATFNEANAVAKGAGLQFGLHNHWWEFVNVDGRSGMDILIEEGLDEDIFFELDTYWIQTAWLNPTEVVSKYAGRVPLLHVKDGPTGIASNMTAVGDGVMDYQRIIAAAPNCEWLVVELDRCDTDMLTAVKGSIDYLIAEGLGHGRS